MQNIHVGKIEPLVQLGPGGVFTTTLIGNGPHINQINSFPLIELSSADESQEIACEELKQKRISTRRKRRAKEFAYHLMRLLLKKSKPELTHIYNEIESQPLLFSSISEFKTNRAARYSENIQRNNYESNS